MDLAEVFRSCIVVLAALEDDLRQNAKKRVNDISCAFRNETQTKQKNNKTIKVLKCGNIIDPNRLCVKLYKKSDKEIY